MKIAIISGVVGAAAIALVIIIFGKEDLICRFRNNIINLFKRHDLKKNMNNLKVMDRDELINTKYTYIKKSKNSRSAGDNFKNFVIVITILIALLNVTIPILMRLNNYALNKLDGTLGYEIEAIKQENISGDEKAKKIREQYKKVINKEFDPDSFIVKIFYKIIDSAVHMVIVCIIVSGFILIVSGVYYDKAASYETLVQYIDNELIEKIKFKKS